MALAYSQYASPWIYFSGTSSYSASGSFVNHSQTFDSTYEAGTTWFEDGGFSSSWNSDDNSSSHPDDWVHSGSASSPGPSGPRERPRTTTTENTTTVTLNVTTASEEVIGTHSMATTSSGSSTGVAWVPTTTVVTALGLSTITEERTFLDLTEDGVIQVAAQGMGGYYDTVVIADTAAGEILEIPTRLGSGIYSDFVTTATATTFTGGPKRADGFGLVDWYNFTQPTGSVTTSGIAGGDLIAETFPVDLAGFPVLTTQNDGEFYYSGVTPTSTTEGVITFPPGGPAGAPYVFAGYSQNAYQGPYVIGLGDLGDGYWAKQTLHLQGALGGPVPNLPPFGMGGDAGASFLNGDFIYVSTNPDFSTVPPYAVPPMRSGFTESGQFGLALNAGVPQVTGPYWGLDNAYVSVAPNVIMPWAEGTVTFDAVGTNGSDWTGGPVTSMTLSWGSSNYSVTSSSSSLDGTETVSASGTTVYHFSTIGATHSTATTDTLAGGNPYFPSATLEGNRELILQTWDTSSSGFQTISVNSTAQLTGNGLSCIDYAQMVTVQQFIVGWNPYLTPQAPQNLPVMAMDPYGLYGARGWGSPYNVVAIT